MNYEYALQIMEASHKILQEKPTDRLDYLNKAMRVQGIIVTCLQFLTDLKGSPYVDEYKEEDLAFIHESFCVSAIPLVHMIEHFLERVEKEAEEFSLAI